ncbi:unnamed protein product [Rotaria sp. Silwood1]|nr:unnamed protein product [Rotaria sp. Silwood1]
MSRSDSTLNQSECLCPFNTNIQEDSRTCNRSIVAKRENVSQCHYVHGKCVYHVDESFGYRLTGCLCFPVN